MNLQNDIYQHLSTPPPTDYFAAMQERVLARIELETELNELAPSLNHLPKGEKNSDLPNGYFENLENDIFNKIQDNLLGKPVLSLEKTQKPTSNRYLRNWLIGSGAVAAAVIGVMWLSPNTVPIAETTPETPLSLETQQLFAQIKTQDAAAFLKEHAHELDETAFHDHEKSIQTIDNQSIIQLEKQDVAEFLENEPLID